MGARDSESRGPWKILGWDNDDAEGGSSAAGSGNLQIKRLINIRSTRVQRGNNSTLPIFLEITFPAYYKKISYSLVSTNHGVEMINIQLLQVWGNNTRVCATISIKMTKGFSISKEILRPLFKQIKSSLLRCIIRKEKTNKQTSPLHRQANSAVAVAGRSKAKS